MRRGCERSASLDCRRGNRRRWSCTWRQSVMPDHREPGDKGAGASRGLPYEFGVSRIVRSSNPDTEPMQPDEDDPRLTLMTCAGVWTPITRDYSERLWVIAEAPEAAEATITRVS